MLSKLAQHARHDSEKARRNGATAVYRFEKSVAIKWQERPDISERTAGSTAGCRTASASLARG